MLIAILVYVMLQLEIFLPSADRTHTHYKHTYTHTIHRMAPFFIFFLLVWPVQCNETKYKLSNTLIIKYITTNPAVKDCISPSFHTPHPSFQQEQNSNVCKRLLIHAHTNTSHTASLPQMALVHFCLLSCTHTHKHTHWLTHTHWLILHKTSWSSSTDSLACFCSLSCTHACTFSHTHTHTDSCHTNPSNTASPQPVLLVSARFFHHDNTHTHRLSLSHTHTHTDSRHINPSNPASSQPVLLLVSAHFFYHAHTRTHATQIQHTPMPHKPR